MYIGPSIYDQADTQNNWANSNLQKSSQNLAENPNNYQFIKFVKVLAAAEVFVYFLPCL